MSNLRSLFFRDKQEQEVPVYEAWEVRWTSRHGQFASDTQPEARLFPDEQSAREFADALRDAFKLIKHASGTSVRVTPQNFK